MMSPMAGMMQMNPMASMMHLNPMAASREWTYGSDICRVRVRSSCLEHVRALRLQTFLRVNLPSRSQQPCPTGTCWAVLALDAAFCD